MEAKATRAPCRWWRHAGLIAMIAAVSLLSGCANSLVNPYVDLKPLEVPEEESFLTEIQATVTDIESQRNDIQHQRNVVMTTRTMLGLGVLGAASGAGIAALYGAHRDLILGLGLGAAGGYTLGTLYIPAEKSTLLNAANTALRCTARRGATAVAVGRKADLRLTNQQGDFDAAVAEFERCKTSSNFSDEDRATVKANLDEFASAKVRFESFKALDSTGAMQLTNASDQITQALNEELEKLAPNLAAILDAAKGIPSLAASFGSGVAVTDVEPPADDGADGDAGVSLLPPPPVCQDDELEVLMSVAGRLGATGKEISADIEGAINGINEIAENCSLTVAAIEPLATNLPEVTINKDSTVIVSLSGGRLPLTLQWSGEQPAATSMEAHVSGRDLYINGRSDPKGGPYKLIVRDKRAVPQTVEITVKVAGGDGS